MCELLSMLVVGFMQTGPDVYQLQLLSPEGEIIEYTLLKNDENLLSLSPV